MHKDEHIRINPDIVNSLINGHSSSHRRDGTLMLKLTNINNSGNYY